MGKKLNSALNASIRDPQNADKKIDRFVGVVLLAALAVFGASWLLSIRLYEKREL